MFPSATMSNSTSFSEESIFSTSTRAHTNFNNLTSHLSPCSSHQNQQNKKKRNQPGNPDPEAEVVALSPNTLMATNRFVCEICNKGFQRDQNLQLHRRGHNLPWKLRQRSGKETARKRVYVCPEVSCVHHHPSRALGDLTGIKKHFCRKHGEKKWKCEKCSKNYAVHSDCKAHVKTCGSKEYRCDCGSIFTRKDSFITHRAFCEALAEESARLSSNTILPNTTLSTAWSNTCNSNPNPNSSNNNTLPFHVKHDDPLLPYFSGQHFFFPAATMTISATTLLERATAMGPLPLPTSSGGLTRDFLGVVSNDVAEEEEFLPLSGLRVNHTKTLPRAWRDC